MEFPRAWQASARNLRYHFSQPIPTKTELFVTGGGRRFFDPPGGHKIDAVFQRRCDAIVYAADVGSLYKTKVQNCGARDRAVHTSK